MRRTINCKCGGINVRSEPIEGVLWLTVQSASAFAYAFGRVEFDEFLEQVKRWGSMVSRAALRSRFGM
jgi:hypothetical protein